MTPPGFERLGARAAQVFLGFVADPAATLHPQWAERLVPAPLREGAAADPAVLSRGIMADQGWAPALPGFRFDDPAHRAALLPPEALEELARAMGVRAIAPQLQRLIARDDVAQMESLLTLAERQLLGLLPEPDWPLGVPQPPDVQALLEALPARGHAALAQALTELDEDIGRRALIKLPPAEAGSDWKQATAQAAAEAAGPGQALARLRQVYEAVIPAWDPHWDALWAPAAEAAQHAQATPAGGA